MRQFQILYVAVITSLCMWVCVYIRICTLLNFGQPQTIIPWFTTYHAVAYHGTKCWFTDKRYGIYVVRVNSRCKFASWLLYVCGCLHRFIYGPCQIIHKDKDTYGNFFSIYETHADNDKQYCRPWSMMSYTCATHTFLSTSVSLLAYLCGFAHMYIYAIIIIL